MAPIMPPEDIIDPSRPVFRIGAVAELLGVHPRTLRLYEEHGLLKTVRKRGQRRYSHNDIRWLRCLRRLIHEEGYSLEAISRLLDFAPCWELCNCPPEVRQNCEAAHDRRLRCWQIAQRTCKRGAGSCEECEVFLRDQALSRQSGE